MSSTAEQISALVAAAPTNRVRAMTVAGIALGLTQEGMVNLRVGEFVPRVEQTSLDAQLKGFFKKLWERVTTGMKAGDLVLKTRSKTQRPASHVRAWQLLKTSKIFAAQKRVFLFFRDFARRLLKWRPAPKVAPKPVERVPVTVGFMRVRKPGWQDPKTGKLYVFQDPTNMVEYQSAYRVMPD